MRSEQARATPHHLLDNLPHWGDHFVKRVNHIQVEIFVDQFEMEIVQQMGRSGTRLSQCDPFGTISHHWREQIGKVTTID